MAATLSVYSRQGRMVRELVNGVATDKELYMYALALTAYSSADNAKSLFHLDYITHHTDPDGKVCFVGGVIDGSINSLYHAAARVSRRNLLINNNVVHLLNDAGLNTTPHAELVEVKYSFINYLVITFRVKKAYYDAGVTVYMRPYDVTQNNMQASDLSIANFTIDGALCTLTVTSLDSFINVQDILKLEIRAANTEGTFINPTTLLTAQLKCKIRVVTLLKVTSVADTTGTVYTCVLTENQFHAVNGNPYVNGNGSYITSDASLLDAFFIATGTNPETATGWPSAVTLNGSDTDVLDDACFNSFLTDGLYKGMPEEFAGEVSTKVITIRTYSSGVGLVSRWDLAPVMVSLSVTTNGTQTLNQLQEQLVLTAGVECVQSGGTVGTITFTLRLQKQVGRINPTWSDETLTYTEYDETLGSVTKTGYVEVAVTGNNVTKTLSGYSGGLNIRRWSVVDINYTSINSATIVNETDNELN